MTYIRHDWLLQHKKAQAESNRIEVLNAVLKLRKATASKVKKYLDDKVQQQSKLEAKKRYENNEITSNEINKEERKYIREHRRVLRTVQRWLRHLEKNHYLILKGYEYSISEKGLHYIRYFIRGFGKNSLSGLCNDCKLSESVQEYIQKFVQTFGVYMLYVFIQLLRINEYNWLSKEEKDEITLSFLENGVPMKKMFDLFTKNLATVDMEELKTIIKNQYQREYNAFQVEWDNLYEGII